MLVDTEVGLVVEVDALVLNVKVEVEVYVDVLTLVDFDVAVRLI